VEKFKPGDPVIPLTLVRFRKSPGIEGKPEDDVIADLPQQTLGVIRGGPTNADGLVWWQMEMPVNGVPTLGWAAEVAPNGIKLLGKPQVGKPVVPSASLQVGDLVTSRPAVNVRKSPGMNNKPADDLLGYYEPKTTLNLIEGPTETDGLPWWKVGGITLSRGETIGWVAQRLADGTELIGEAPKLPGTDVPNKVKRLYLNAPFIGSYGLSQLWGENPQIYGRFTYDGVKLKGHNGIDFLTPVGTALTAVDDGVVAAAVLNDPGGFGNYVKINHSWGESIYAHMETLKVSEGQTVKRGDVIGTSGNTGFSGGPHLHFAIRINPASRTDGWGGFSDPLPYLRPEDVKLPKYVQEVPASDAAYAPQPPAPHDFAPGYGPEMPGAPRP
jgi:hypothetical protein